MLSFFFFSLSYGRAQAARLKRAIRGDTAPEGSCGTPQHRDGAADAASAPWPRPRSPKHPPLTAIFPAPPPPPPPPLAISSGTARSDVEPRRSPLAARGRGAGRPGRALGTRCGRVRPDPGRNKAAAARQARHGGAAPPLASPAAAGTGQWLCRAVPGCAGLCAPRATRGLPG